MHEVVVSRSIDAPREAVDRVLSPTSIVELARTYEVRHVERTDDAVVVTGETDELETVLEFTETEGAYIYRQLEDQGPFEEMYASVSLVGDAPVEVTARTCFTFDLPLTRLTDWLAASQRRTELERLLAGLDAAVGTR